ncbi:MAG: deoxyribose-phosphate aldolase [Oscillospiraceae bacterium]|nr:deoxyribose-phosphate aldolase [Oscillospiraceae bacterium]
MKNELSALAARIDHTNLKINARWEDIRLTCDEAIKGGAASVCIPPCFVKRASDYMGNAMKVCTVIGFPNGYNTTEMKCAEARQAIADGAEELDFVINIGMVKNKDWEAVDGELSALRSSCEGKVMKVIIETCALTDDEKIVLCGAVSKCGAEYIKTSTGFSTGGATAADVALLRANVAENVKVKASGGIRTVEFAQELVKLGADRIGASAVLPVIIKEGENI